MHERGIEIGLKSQEAVKTMKPPTTKKELQKLIGKINFVRRFISNLSGRPLSTALISLPLISLPYPLECWGVQVAAASRAGRRVGAGVRPPAATAPLRGAPAAAAAGRSGPPPAAAAAWRSVPQPTAAAGPRAAGDRHRM